MPFKSEKQRKYLWANEPEIARDWTDTYGSRIHKAGGQLVQPGLGRPGYRGDDYDYAPGTTNTRYSDRNRGGQDTGGEWVPYTQPKIKPKHTPDRDGILNKFKNWQRTSNTAARMKHIKSKLDHKQIMKLVELGLVNYDEPTTIPADAGLTTDVIHTGGVTPTDLLSSGDSLKTLQDQFDYTGGKLNPADDRGEGQPYIYPPTGIASIDDTPTTQTASTLGGGHFQVPLAQVLNQQRAAEGGRIGYQMGNMVEGEIEGAEMEGAMMQSEEVIKELYDALIAQGLSPQEAMEKIKQIIASTQTEGPQSPMMGEEFPGQEFGRAPAAFGGIMDTYTGRRKYGLGSFISKAFKKVKKLASSKIGKLALMYAAGTYLGGTQAFGGTGYAGGAPWKKFGKQLLNPLGDEGIANIGRKAMSYLKKPTPVSDAGIGGEKAMLAELTAETGALTEAQKIQRMINLSKTTPAAKSFLPGISNKTLAGVALPSIAAGLYTAKMPLEELDDSTSEYDDKKAAMDAYLADMEGAYRLPENRRLAAEGGLMDLGGMEKDYRNDGGFVPIGGQEKADDVPARLSRNEFVFTADAVRNAGGGDIDRGAEVMENVMKNLEGGGKISEESQGQGAQEMFETSERLSEVI